MCPGHHAQSRPTGHLLPSVHRDAPPSAGPARAGGRARCRSDCGNAGASRERLVLGADPAWMLDYHHAATSYIARKSDRARPSCADLASGRRREVDTAMPR